MGEQRSRAAAPLSGVRVVSLAEQYPGPYATMILADLGAEVVMVERTGGGDPTRRFDGHFEALNRGKRSLAIDLKSVQGKSVMDKLLATADVLIEGFRPGVMDRLGFGADEVGRRFPSLVYCSVSALGQTGPLSPRGGHDLTLQGMAGFVSSDEPAPLPLADLSSALFSALGIVTSLYARRESGRGATVDVAMLDSLISWRTIGLVSSMNDLTPSPYPPRDPGYGVFRTEDGVPFSLSIAGEDHQWLALCQELGLDGLAALTTLERESREDELSKRLAEACATVPWDHLSGRLEARGVGFGPVHDDAGVVADPQVRARGLVVEVADGSGVRVVRQPIVINGQASTVPFRAPRLGQDTDRFLVELGYSPHEIDELSSAGVVGRDQEVRG
ncbi:CaiB/BaiF CoA transferase family protein [Micromonospora sp. NPDC005161]